MSRRGLMLMLFVAACGSEAPAPASSPAAVSGGAGSAAAVSCTAGPLACFCPDGQRSGTQECDARQQLSACQCNVSASTDTGVAGDPKRVCAQLAGQQSCDARSYVSPQLPSSVLFVIDRSGSMACNAPPVQSVDACNANPMRLDPSQPSRWEITSGALDAAFAGLKGSAAAVGVSMFSVDGYCGVDSTPVVGLDNMTDTHLGALSDALHGAMPAGGTPIVGAVISAYHHLHEELHAAGNRYVVLITDGEEDCGTLGDATNKADLMAARDRLLDTEVENARAANIHTFVVGAPGSEGARGFLSELAFRGGTARTATCMHPDRTGATGDCHYDLTQERDFAGVLQKTLGQISGAARGCEFKTPTGAGPMLNVQVSLNGEAPSCLARDNAPCDGGANGWQFPMGQNGAPDMSRVVLCGDACQMVKDNPASVVDVILGCPMLL